MFGDKSESQSRGTARHVRREDSSGIGQSGLKLGWGDDFGADDPAASDSRKRAARHARARSASRDNNRQRRRNPRNSPGRDSRAASRNPGRRGGVPVALAVLLVVAFSGLSVLVTFLVMNPRVVEAQKEAQAAQQETAEVRTQVTTLTEQLQKEIEKTKSIGKSDAKDSKEGVEDPWVESGYFTSGDSVLDTEVKAYCDSVVDKSMALNDAALAVYTKIAWSDYVERDSAQHPSGKDWRTVYARQYYESGCSGNCYEFASFLMYCMQYLGFSDAKAEGVELELSSGGWGDHGIVFVTNTDGSSCLCDTARGTDGWMLSSTAYNMNILDFENA